MRFIDADALPKYTGYALSADEVAMAVENAPTIDAVPVVRCRDCIYYDNLCRCDLLGIPMERLNFCSYGERKDNEII